MKQQKIIGLFVFMFLIFLLQSNRIYSQPISISETNLYCELKINNGDTILEISGSGVIPTDIKSKIAQVLKGKTAKWDSLNINTIEIKEGITKIEKSAFSKSSRLKTISLPQTLTFIDMYAFNSCNILETINFQEGLDSICNACFAHTNLKDTLKLPNSIRFIGESAFQQNESLTHVILPSKLEALNLGVFARCENLVSVVIPASIKVIESLCFSRCENLSEVINFSLQPQKIDTAVFAYVNRSLCRLIVPTSLIETYKSAPVWQEFKIEGGASINELSNNVLELVLSPNPVKDILYITPQEEITDMEVVIYDMLGRVLLQSKQQYEIPLQTLAKGLYLIRITTPLKVGVYKMLKE